MTEKTCDNFICTDPKFEFNLQTDILLDIIWKSKSCSIDTCMSSMQWLKINDIS